MITTCLSINSRLQDNGASATVKELEWRFIRVVEQAMLAHTNSGHWAQFVSWLRDTSAVDDAECVQAFAMPFCGCDHDEQIVLEVNTNKDTMARVI